MPGPSITDSEEQSDAWLLNFNSAIRSTDGPSEPGPAEAAPPDSEYLEPGKRSSANKQRETVSVKSDAEDVPMQSPPNGFSQDLEEGKP